MHEIKTPKLIHLRGPKKIYNPTPGSYRFFEDYGRWYPITFLLEYKGGRAILWRLGAEGNFLVSEKYLGLFNPSATGNFPSLGKISSFKYEIQPTCIKETKVLQAKMEKVRKKVLKLYK